MVESHQQGLKKVKMWIELPIEMKEDYKNLILAFASLSEVFAQKNVEDVQALVPIINTKYQETVFNKAFHASVEDTANTSYDAALKINENQKRHPRFLGMPYSVKQP